MTIEEIEQLLDDLNLSGSVKQEDDNIKIELKTTLTLTPNEQDEVSVKEALRKKIVFIGKYCGISRAKF